MNQDQYIDMCEQMGWEIDESKLLKVGNTTLEIYTLEKFYKKKYWILKCQIAYYISSSSTQCRMP